MSAPTCELLDRTVDLDPNSGRQPITAVYMYMVAVRGLGGVVVKEGGAVVATGACATWAWWVLAADLG